MPKRANREVAVGQEQLSFDGPLRTDIGFEFNQKEAEAAKQHRLRRRGELALNARTGGFMSRVGRLWIPHSGTELSAVVALPEIAILQQKHFIREKVHEKYDDNPDVSAQQVQLWAYFAANRSEKELRGKYASFQLQSRDMAARIRRGLLPEGEIIRERIEADTIALNAVAAYLVYLRTFVAAPGTLDARDKRKWPQRRHTKANAERLEIAQGQLDAMPTHEFSETVREAYWNERSRNRFWVMMEAERKEYARKSQYWDKKHDAEKQLPIEAYDQDPRASEENYVDGEFIDD
jgi:hypothetical protein